ncbi:MAG: hypothetical protein ACT4P4_16925, partial [Betaproteobacteria bacterium]
MKPHARDLFGEVAVTLDDLLAWMIAVPAIAPRSPRFAFYLRHYDVIAKIQAHKLAGTFDAAIEEINAGALHPRLGAVIAAARGMTRRDALVDVLELRGQREVLARPGDTRSAAGCS